MSDQKDSKIPRRRFLQQAAAATAGFTGSGRGMPCGQYANGRLVQTCTSLTSPMAPAQMSSFTRRASSDECPWLPIWVATFVSFAFFASVRASSTDQVSGFCT